MKKFTLTISGNTFYNPDVIINNELIRFKNGKNKSKIYTIETDKNELDIMIIKWHELESDNWLIMSILFFIISLFGIFDIKDKKNNIFSLNYKGKIILNEEENNLKLIFGSLKNNQKAFKNEGNCYLEDNETNIYLVNEIVEKRKKMLKKIKIALWIILIIAILLIFILNIL